MLSIRNDHTVVIMYKYSFVFYEVNVSPEEYIFPGFEGDRVRLVSYFVRPQSAENVVELLS